MDPKTLTMILNFSGDYMLHHTGIQAGRKVLPVNGSIVPVIFILMDQSETICHIYWQLIRGGVMKKLIFILCFVGFAANGQIKLEEGQPKITENGILMEANDAGETVLIPRDGLDIDVHHRYFHFKKSFEDVSSVLTREVEDAFDMFIFVNVSYERNGSSTDYIPSQHMKVFRKRFADQAVFNRTAFGRIDVSDPVRADVLGHDGHQPALAGLPGLIPVSSGASHFGSGYVDTFSGVFRVNHSKSLSRRYGQGMFHSLYVDIVYPSGRESGIAIHGTFDSRYSRLGTQASHGCIRVTKPVANTLYEYVLSEGMYEPHLLDFSRSERLPVGPLRNPRPGYKALIVFFYGYEGNRGLDI